VSAGTILITSVIDSTTNFIEHPELVAEWIGRYARLVGRENVVAVRVPPFDTLPALSTAHSR